MHTTAKRVMTLCAMVVVLALVASITAIPALALGTGIYVADAHPHYRHPVTGAIEDSGGESSEVLGQSMTESASHNRALIEVEENGDTYVTIRLKLMDNIENVRIQADGRDVTADCMQEDLLNATSDFRFPVESQKSIIRVSMYVTAMGRDVVFYMTFDGLQFGCEDFIPSIEAPMEGEMPLEEEPAAPEAPEATAAPQVTPAPQTQEASGLQEFDEGGNAVGAEEAPAVSGSNAMPVVLGVIAVAAIGFAIWYFGFFRKKK